MTFRPVVLFHLGLGGGRCAPGIPQAVVSGLCPTLPVPFVGCRGPSPARRPSPVFLAHLSWRSFDMAGIDAYLVVELRPLDGGMTQAVGNFTRERVVECGSQSGFAKMPCVLQVVG